MNLYIALSLLFGTTAVCLFFGINAKSIGELLASPRRKSLRKLAETHKPGRLHTLASQVLTALRVTGQSGKAVTLLILAAALGAAGVFVGIGVGNWYLTPVLAIALAAVPMIYIRVQYRNYRTLLLDELEVGLEVITASYLRTENIVSAVKENLDNLQDPLRTMFHQFLYAVERTGLPVETAIGQLKIKVQASSFSNWCDALTRCMADRNLKTSLLPCVEDLTDAQIERSQAATLLHDAVGDFRMVAILSVVFVLLKYTALPAALGVPFGSAIQQFFLAIDVLLLSVFSLQVYFITTDIELD